MGHAHHSHQAELQNFSNPDEIREFPQGRVELVQNAPPMEELPDMEGHHFDATTGEVLDRDGDAPECPATP